MGLLSLGKLVVLISKLIDLLFILDLETSAFKYTKFVIRSNCSEGDQKGKGTTC